MKTEEALQFAGGDSDAERKANAEAIATAATDFENFRTARIGTSSGMAELSAQTRVEVRDENGNTESKLLPLSLANPDPVSVPEGFDVEANQKRAQEEEAEAERRREEETEARINAEVERRLQAERDNA